MFPLIVKAQGNFAIAEVQYSTFNMEQLKSFQHNYISQTGLPLKAVTSFPSWWGYGGAFGWALHNGSLLGLLLNYNSTGARADYEDYSGTARMDQLLHCISIGAFYQVQLNRSQKWPCYFHISASNIHTTMKVTESFIVGTQSQSNGYVFYSTNYGLKPAFLLRRQFKRSFIHAGLGYEVQFTGKLYLKDNNKAYLTNPSGDNVTAQWGGLRLALGVGILLNKRTPE
jgi:hypothetical protein